MSFNASWIVKSDEGSFHLMVKTDENKTSLLLYIAPPLSRPDTQQNLLVRSFLVQWLA